MITTTTTSRSVIDNNEIDLSGSFKLTSITTTPKTALNSLQYNLSADCKSQVLLRFLIQLNSNATSGFYKFPNGTEITYARCEVVMIKHPD